MGWILSDASREAYVSSIYSGHNVSYSLAVGIEAGYERDAELLRKYGSAYNLAEKQSDKTAFPDPPRSRFSVTTNLERAIYYADGGSVYASWIPIEKTYTSPKNNTTGNESEYFITSAYPMQKINPNFTNEDLKED